MICAFFLISAADEITMQDKFTAHVHLSKDLHRNIPWIERVEPLPLNEFMFGRWCRSMGYASIEGRSEEQNMRINMHLKPCTIPTITENSADDIRNPNKMAAMSLEMATGD